MSFTKKRKISEMDRPVDSFNETTPKSTPTPDPGCAEDENSTRNSGNDTIPDDGNTANADTIETNHDERMERFKALQLRARKSVLKNHKDSAAESQRLKTDATQLASLARKHAFASHSLLKADTAASGEDFERKRAWDWTVEESEKWDRRMAKKDRHREDVAFQDYRQDARKIYKRQLRELNPDTENYEKEKAIALQKAAASGGVEIVETAEGELIGVDKSGAFYATANSTDFVENKPAKANVDKLVADIKKAEEIRLRKRRERGRGDEEGDVTYINDKNKEFNKRLARSYNKYTAEIRDSFERGTMI